MDQLYGFCKQCKKVIRIKYGNKTNKSGLCIDCYKEKQKEDKIKLWLETGDTGCSVNTTLKNCIRKYIYEQQNYCCEICGISNVWNNKDLNFILDHIDGDASNNHRENLRLICPNCDSQLDTYKSRNKNSARNLRKQFLHETTNMAVYSSG